MLLAHAPLILSHEFSGTIEKIGGNVKGFELGKRVKAETHAEYSISCRKMSVYKKINEIMGVERAIKYHSLILEAINDKDENRARDLMKEHIDTTVGDIYEKYSE